MRTSTILVTPAALEPVTVQEAMGHCRVSDTADEDYIASLIQAVRTQVEMLTGRALAAETRKLLCADWPETTYSIDLDRSPASSITTIDYLPDGYGAAVTVDASNYFLAEGEPSRVIFKDSYSFPALAIRPDAVRVTYSTTPSTIPHGLRQAMLLQIAHLYDVRASVNIGNIVTEVPHAFRALLEMHRIGGFVA
jgi:uncharacterized phiE125 gp8 family phage protein